VKAATRALGKVQLAEKKAAGATAELQSHKQEQLRYAGGAGRAGQGGDVALWPLPGLAAARNGEPAGEQAAVPGGASAMRPAEQLRQRPRPAGRCAAAGRRKRSARRRAGGCTTCRQAPRGAALLCAASPWCRACPGAQSHLRSPGADLGPRTSASLPAHPSAPPPPAHTPQDKLKSAAAQQAAEEAAERERRAAALQQLRAQVDKSRAAMATKSATSK
jgi:hypothetical protein